MWCKNCVKFLVAFFVLETSLAQYERPATLQLTEANFNHTIAYYQVVFVTFLSDDSSSFWITYHYGMHEIERRFAGNSYAAIGVVVCPEGSLCKREYDTLAGPLTSENMLKFIDKYLDDDHDLIHVNSGDGDWNDSEEVQTEINRRLNRTHGLDLDEKPTESSDKDSLTDLSTDSSVTELVSSTFDETLSRNSSFEFSFEDDLTEIFDDNSTESSTSFSNANPLYRATDLITFSFLLYYFCSH